VTLGIIVSIVPATVTAATTVTAAAVATTVAATVTALVGSSLGDQFKPKRMDRAGQCQNKQCASHSMTACDACLDQYLHDRYLEINGTGTAVLAAQVTRHVTTALQER
jgi:hypothetical protein